VGRTSLVFCTSLFIKVRVEGGNNDLALKIPDLDAVIGGGTEPVTVGAEDERVDGLTGVKAVKTLALVKVPEHGSSVLSSGGTERTIGGDTDSVEVSGVANQVIAELAVGECPDLYKTVPSA